MTKLKLGIFVNNFLLKSETFIYNRIKNYKQFEVQVICSDTRKELNKAHKPMHAYSQRKNYFQTLPRFIYKTLVNEKIDLLQAHYSVNAFNCIEPARQAGVPLVTFFHGSDIYSYMRDMLFKSRLKNLFDKGDYFVVPCNYMKHYINALGCNAEKILVNYGVVDTDLFKPDIALNKNNQFRVVIAGKFIEVKGIEFGIEGFKKFYDRFNTGELIIIGEGEKKKQLEKAARGYPVNFVPFLDQTKFAQQLKQASAVIVPSIYSKEGQPDNCPNIIKEAMACGKPVIASNIAGIPELIKNNTSGLLVEQKDITHIANALEYLHFNPKENTRIGNQARLVAKEKFNLEKQMLKRKRSKNPMVFVKK